MPESTNYSAAQAAWIDFTTSVRGLLVPQAGDRPLDQYLVMRDNVIALAQSPQFLAEFQAAWAPRASAPKLAIGNVLLMELQAFRRAIEVAQATEVAQAESKDWVSKWLGRASTTVDSVKEFVEMAPFGKGVMTLLKEVIDLFKG
jgi:hypothetical protein